MKLIFDIEADNLKDEVSKIWCISTLNIETGEELLFNVLDDNIQEGIDYLSIADTLIAHNGINYDAEVIYKLYNVKLHSRIIDTMLLSKLNFPDQFFGHSLEAWGDFLKIKKGGHSDWSQYSQEMGLYCMQDSRVTLAVFQYLKSKVDYTSNYYKLERTVAIIQAISEREGVVYNKKEADNLLSEIDAHMYLISNLVLPNLGYKLEYSDKATAAFTAKRERTKASEAWYGDQVENVFGSFCKVEFTKITLDTKKFLIEKLLSMGWKPSMFTEKGSPKISDKGTVCENLLKMGNEYALVGKYFILKHRRSLIDGLSRFIRKDGTIPSEADTIGAATHRYTHRKIANLPSVVKDKNDKILTGLDGGYGLEIRSLFGVKDGYVAIGCDLAGIEARLLAHYMDDEEFTDIILNGDIHSYNQEKAGLPTRSAAKSFFYAFLYGAGDEKIGSLINGSAMQGRAIKEQFLSSLPRLKELIDGVKWEAEKGYITAIDGRKIRVRKGEDGKYQTHKALNLLLQSAGAIYAKVWISFIYKQLKNIYATILVTYHDEVLIQARDEDIDKVSNILHKAREQADSFLAVNCQNDIAIKIGKTWADVH